MHECICCNYRTKLKHHLEQHMQTQKHRNQYTLSGHLYEEYTKRMEELGFRHIKEVEDLYVSQERQRKELDQEMRLEMCKRLCNTMND